jgi:hypothetical protein
VETGDYAIKLLRELLERKKSKAIAVIGHGDPYGCKMSRLPHLLGSQLTDDSEVVSLTHWLPFT